MKRLVVWTMLAGLAVCTTADHRTWGASSPVIVVADADGAAARVAAPVSLSLDLAAIGGALGKAETLQLVEMTKDGKGAPLPVQFVAQAKDATQGTLWWLMPPGPKGERRFQLVRAAGSGTPTLIANLDAKSKAVDVSDGGKPVLRYNQGTVPPPSHIVEAYEKKPKPQYFARGDYIHPIWGPDGEILTDDYSLDHPHHRGLCWAWPVVRWKGEVRDIWAVAILPPARGAVWARPVSMDRVEAGPVLAAIDAENVWKWGDKDPIVREEVSIRAFRQEKQCRFLDVKVRFTALVDDLTIGGRPHASYGGFTFRTFPKFSGRKIDMHVDPASVTPRRAWFHLTGNFPGGKGAAGMAMFESLANPDYPSYPRLKTDPPDRVPAVYPPWRSVQPAWPGDREVPLAKGKPVVLEHRVWIHPGLADDVTLAGIWSAYAQPPKARLEP